MVYSLEFRQATVEKILKGERTVLEIEKESGVSDSTIYRWLHRSGNLSEGESKILAKKKRPQEWSADEKFRALMETAGYNEEEQGAYCRRNGIHVSQLNLWKESCVASMRKGPKTDPEKKALKLENQNLKRDLRRKEKALAETTALLVLKKKAAEIFGNSEDGEDI